MAAMDARPDALTSAIGRSIPRVDGRPKVTGQARFAADYEVRGLLHARPVLAMPAHARIERIDVAAALAVPGVVAVLTAADLPIVSEGNDRVHEPLARNEILWAGQPVALVVAESPEAAADAAPLVSVETTALEAVVDLERAFAPGAPRARLARPVEAETTGSAESQHAAVGGGAEQFTPDEPGSDNVAARNGFRRGDIATTLAGCDVIVEGRFTTSWVHQGYLETQVATAALDDDGVLHLTSATQGTFHTRWELARLFGRPMAAVRVTGATLGGAFGGKYLIVDPLAAAATLVLGRPVRVELTRNEDFRMSQPRAGGDPGGPRGGDARRAASRPPGAAPVRRRCLRGVEHRGHRGGPDHRAVPLGGPRGHRLRGRDQSLRDRGLPGARGDPGDLRARAADRRARAPPRHGPHRPSGAQRRLRGRRDGRRDVMGRDRPGRVPGPDRRPPALSGPGLAS